MLDPVDIDAFRRIIDPIENAIVPDPDTIAFFSRQLEATDRTGLPGQAADLLNNAGEIQGFELVEIPLRRREDEDVIHGDS